MPRVLKVPCGHGPLLFPLCVGSSMLLIRTLYPVELRSRAERHVTDDPKPYELDLVRREHRLVQRHIGAVARREIVRDLSVKEARGRISRGDSQPTGCGSGRRG